MSSAPRATADADLEFAIKLPLGGDMTPDEYVRITKSAETAGFDVAFLGDHLVFPASTTGAYPGSPSSPFDPTQHCYDQYQVFAHLAAETTAIGLCSDVCIAPLRHPLVLAKLAVGLDVFSDGRYELGVGVGWLRAEFEALGVPFEQRGSRTDEFLQLFERACSTGEFAFDGPHHSFEAVGVHPRPVQDGGPPVWIGGSSAATFRRVAEHGVGWAAGPLSLQDIEDNYDRLLHAWRDHDRRGEPAISTNLTVRLGSRDYPEAATSLDDVRGRIDEASKAGVSRIGFDFRRVGEPPTRVPLDEQIEQLERIGDEVLRSNS